MSFLLAEAQCDAGNLIAVIAFLVWAGFIFWLVARD
jgi:hypothetical protein